MKIKPGSWFLVFILLLMVYSIAESISFRHYEATLVPLLLSMVIFVLGAIELVRELRSPPKQPRPAEDEDMPPTVVAQAAGGSEMRRFGLALGWIGGFAVSVWILGFLLSTLLFAVSYLKTKGLNWLSSAAFAVGFTVVLYVVFELGFRSQLSRGLVFGG
jgi:hypothetical protein